MSEEKKRNMTPWVIIVGGLVVLVIGAWLVALNEQGSLDLLIGRTTALYEKNCQENPASEYCQELETTLAISRKQRSERLWITAPAITIMVLLVVGFGGFLWGQIKDMQNPNWRNE